MLLLELLEAGLQPSPLAASDGNVVGQAANGTYPLQPMLVMAGSRDPAICHSWCVQPASSLWRARRTLWIVTIPPLDHTSRRLRHMDTTAVEADVLKPLLVAGPFDSAALHLVIHCLPGPLSRKALAVANVAAVLAPTGVLFGASVLGTSGPHSSLARRVLGAFNRRGAFDNLDDSAAGLRDILGASFERVELETVGSIAIFTARTPRPSSPG